MTALAAAPALSLDAAGRDWLSLAEEASDALDRLLADALAAVRARVTSDGRISSSLVERDQHAAHGLAWLATYAETVRELAAYGRRLQAEGRYGETEALLVAIGLGEYCAQIFGGIPMSQGEIAAPAGARPRARPRRGRVDAARSRHSSPRATVRQTAPASSR